MKVKVAVTSDLVDGQMKEVTVGTGGKALLCRVNGEFYATSHLCPHYKAPLVKGVLSVDGDKARIECPWHGACFDAKTGDIEDAPSLDSLHSYKVTVSGSDVYIEADPVGTLPVTLNISYTVFSQYEPDMKTNKRVPVCKKPVKRDPKKHAVILGGGAGGLLAAETLRLEGYPGKITIVSRESYLPIDRPKLSKSLKVDAEKIQLRDAAHLKSLDIEEATAVDTTAQTVTLNDENTLQYTSLVIATGGDPRVFDWPGKELKNIFIIRSADHANQIAEALTSFTTSKGSKPSVVIVGSSFIGMEAASILSKQANVTVVGMEAVPFERVLGPKVGAALGKLTERNGVTLKMKSLVDKFLPAKEDKMRVGSVKLKSGESLSVDFVILGAGVSPKTDYLKTSGISLDRDGGITVLPSMAIAGVSDVYAVGDIARYKYHLTDEMVRVEHWNVAQNQGRLAAQNIISKEMGLDSNTSFTQIPYFWTVLFGKSIRYAGHAESFDDIIIQGSLEMDESGGGLAFVAYYLRKNRVLAVCSLGKDPIVSHASELLRLGKMPTGDELAKGLDLLQFPLLGDAKPKSATWNVWQLGIPVLIAVVSAIFVVWKKQ